MVQDHGLSQWTTDFNYIHGLTFHVNFMYIMYSTCMDLLIWTVDFTYGRSDCGLRLVQDEVSRDRSPRDNSGPAGPGFGWTPTPSAVGWVVQCDTGQPV